MRFSFLLLSLSIILASCTLGSQTPAPSATSPSATTTSPTPSTSYKDDLAKASSKITATPEFENCMKPSVNMCLNQVGNDMARTQKSEAICDELSDASSKDACKYGVVMIKATEAKDIKLCTGLSENYTRECRMTLIRLEASEKKDIKLCESLETELDTASGQLDVGMKSMQIDQCKLNVIQSSSESTATDCEGLIDANVQTMCKDMLKNRPEMPVVSPTTPAQNTEISTTTGS